MRAIELRDPLRDLLRLHDQELARGSSPAPGRGQRSAYAFEEVAATLSATTGARIGKRQVEELAARAAQDFDDFYAARELAAEKTTDLLVLTFDGKGVPMRREHLRPETRKAAETTPRRLQTRLTKGEKRHRKWMAQVAAVYTVAPHVRTLQDLLTELRPVRDAAKERQRPRPTNKLVWASLEKEPEEVISDAFDEALRRDPQKARPWIVLVDGNRDQLRLVKKAAKKRDVRITIIVDLIHVLEYLWKASYAFHPDGSKEAESWVQQRLAWLLRGEHTKVRTNIRRNATARSLDSTKLEPVRKCLRYLRGVRRFLAYNSALAAGFPIATGVIEGVCRYLVKDRMEKTGARWSTPGAEAVLRLRALRASGDFDAYWAFHLDREHARHHRTRYASETPPLPIPALKPILRRVE
ncbi:MAG: ISKra4 family transposase [Labilithrix sp.]